MKVLKRASIVLAATFALCFGLAATAHAWDEDVTHPDLTKSAARNSNLETQGFLKDIGFWLGLDDRIFGYPILDWIRSGSKYEDSYSFFQLIDGSARFYNHFHDPLDAWESAGLNDYLYFPIYMHVTGQSSLLWAQDGARQSGAPKGDQSWAQLRGYYYLALTATTDYARDLNFAGTFWGLGFQMHLVQDAGVPEHVRNDQHAIEGKIGRSRGYAFFEAWAWKKRSLIKELAANPVFPDMELDVAVGDLAPITRLIDANEYTGSNPSNSLAQGLAEYTNANFFSDSTIFAAENKSPDSRHYYPYPKKTSTNVEALVAGDLIPQVVVAADGFQETVPYIRKIGDGEVFDHLLRPTYHSTDVRDSDSGFQEFFRTFARDEACHEDYASFVVPRAVGYSAALLDYFFRGTIEITVPDSGGYAMTEDRDAGFSRVALMALNTAPDNEAMSNGSIQLAVKYKIALEDPFQSQPVPTTDEFSYILVPELNDIRSIPRDKPVMLEFDLSASPIPANATDVFLQVVYRGTLGAETDAVAVGFKDISEPTPVDFYNAMDRICLYGGWFEAGSGAAIAMVDDNGNGIADTDEWDVYPHDIRDFYVRFCPLANPQYPTDTDYDFMAESLAVGSHRRVFLLADYRYSYARAAFRVVHTHPDDRWRTMYMSPGMYSGRGVRNQTELADPDLCIANGIDPPCYVRHYPSYKLFRGLDMWGGLVIINEEYPMGSECSLNSMP